MSEINFGINIIEIVTEGLYPNSLDTFREYIQNSCDAIDDAIDAGTLREGDGEIDIDINKKARRIIFKDNGIGISSLPKDFVRIMSNIGNSDKSLNSDRGFRGIGRLGGLAYCKTLIFSTKVAGEKKISTLTINADKLRKEFWSGNKRSAESVLLENMRFDTVIANPDCDEHFFCVEMIDIVDTNKDLLDVVKIRDYLSFVAPVPYRNYFFEQAKIYEYAAKLGFKITEYKIEVNGEQVVKNYKTKFKTAKGFDEVFNLDFHDFHDEADNLIAWSWVSLSTFRGVIDETKASADNKMRGIRLRAGNIQIGDQYALQKFFKEDRGTKYFIGEVYAVDKNLRPNTKRDYFEENTARNVFEYELEKYFTELHKLYHDSVDIRTAFRDVSAPEKLKQEFAERSLAYQKSHKTDHELKLATLEDAAKKANKKIQGSKQAAENNPDAPLSQVFERIAKQYPPLPNPDEPATLRGGLLENRINLLRIPTPIRLKKKISRRPVGQGKNAPFTLRRKTSSSIIQNCRAWLFSTRLKRSLSNEPPRFAVGARLQKQIHSVKLDEVGDIFSACVRGRRALLQGRLENFRGATFA